MSKKKIKACCSKSINRLINFEETNKKRGGKKTNTHTNSVDFRICICLIKMELIILKIGISEEKGDYESLVMET